MRKILKYMVVPVVAAGLAILPGNSPGLLFELQYCQAPSLGPYVVDGQSMVFYDKVCNKEPVLTKDWLDGKAKEQAEREEYLKERAGIK